MLKLFSFSGRAKRLEYWGMSIFLFLLIIFMGILGAPILLFTFLAIIIIPVYLIMTWLGFAVVVRRLRDAGMNVWLVLLLLVPIVGGIAGIVFGCVGSKKSVKSKK